MAALGPTCVARAAFAEEFGEREVALARAAFEYRDFQEVVDVLGPVLEPPKMTNVALEADARELFGVSLYLLERKKEARREFALLLRLDPRRQLDAFVVPPEVVDAFASVRREMAATLERIEEERGRTTTGRMSGVQASQDGVSLPKSERSETTDKAVEVPPRWTAFLPFGLADFAMREPAWGSLWLGTQAAGLGANVTGWMLADAECHESARSSTRCTSEQARARNRALAIQYIGLGVFAASWIAGSIHAWFAWEPRHHVLASPKTTPSPTIGIAPFRADEALGVVLSWPIGP